MESDPIRISIVVPCYNQGRFLTDCLESLVFQEKLPHEVIVVNDGSTEADTNELCDRLGWYSYPFPLRCLQKPNGGLSSARNHGISASSGNVIVALDADDMLKSNALLEYSRFLAEHPEIDVCYPDVQLFGIEHSVWRPMDFNPWVLLQRNQLVCASAVRKRVFDAGYRFELATGYEDWELWIRACALGPFKAAPLRKTVFRYRKWGFSMLSACDETARSADIRRRHETAGLWTPAIDRNLRTSHAPSHRAWKCSDVANERPLDDFGRWSGQSLEAFLGSDCKSRFIWLGDCEASCRAHLQWLVNELAPTQLACIYAFCFDGEMAPRLIVLDRAAARSRGLEVFETPRINPVARVQLQGKRFPCVASVSQMDLAELRHLVCDLGCVLQGPLFPPGYSQDSRLAEEVYFYLNRELLTPRFTVMSDGEQTDALVIVLPSTVFSDETSTIRVMLDEGRLRRRFGHIVLITFDDEVSFAHEYFESHVEGIFRLGCMGDRERQLSIAGNLLQSIRPSHFWIMQSEQGLELIQSIRNAQLPTRIVAHLGELAEVGENGRLVDGFAMEVVSRYSRLIDRVATSTEANRRQLVELYYFPKEKVRAVARANDESLGRYAHQMLEWLFPKGSAGELDFQRAVFGVNQVA